MTRKPSSALVSKVSIDRFIDTHPDTGCEFATMYLEGKKSYCLKCPLPNWFCADKYLEGGRPKKINPGWMPNNYKYGYIAGALKERHKTCRLLAVAFYKEPAYECSNCRETINGDTRFMKYCYRCGAGVE